MTNLLQGLINGGPKKERLDTTPQEMKELLGKAQEEKGSLKRLLDQLQDKIKKVGSFYRAVHVIEERLGVAQDDLQKVEGFTDSAKRLFAEQDSLRKRAKNLDVQMKKAEENQQSLTGGAAEAEKTRVLMRTVVDLGSEADQKLAALKQETRSIDHVQKRVLELNQELNKIQGKGSALSIEHDRLRAGAQSIEKRTEKARESGGQLKEEVKRAIGRVSEIEGQLADLPAAQGLARSLEKQVHGLNAMAEHVSQKAKSLEAVTDLVEKAKAEQGRLHGMQLEMGLEMKKVSRNSRQLEKTSQKIDELQQMYKDLEGQIRAAKDEKNGFVEQRERLKKELDASLESIQKEANRFKMVQDDLVLADNRVDDLNSRLRTHEGQIKQMAAKDEEISIVNKKVDALSSRVQGLKSVADGLGTKLENLDPMHKRLDQLAGLSSQINRQMETLNVHRAAVDSVGEKLSNITTIHNDVQGKLEKLKEERAEVERVGRVLSDFRAASIDAEVRVNRLTERLQTVDELQSRLKEIELFSQLLEAKTAELMPRIELLQGLESRLNHLSELSQSVDTRVSEQLSKQAELESMRHTQAGLAQQVADLHKQLSSQQQSTKLGNLGRQLNVLEERVESAGKNLGEVRATDEAFLDHQKQARDVLQKLGTATVRADGRVERLEAFKGEFDQVGELSNQWGEQVVQIEARQRELEVSVEATDSHLSKVGELRRDLENRQADLAASEKGMAEYERTLDSHKELVEAVDRKIEFINSRQASVDRIKHDVEGLYEIAHRTRKEATKVAGTRQEILDTKELLDQLQGQTVQVQKKLRSVEAKHKYIEEAESKVDQLSLLMQDIDVNLENFHGQKAIIDHVAEKTAQLDFSIKHAEIATRELQEERDLAAGIYRSVQLLRSDSVAKKRSAKRSERGEVTETPTVSRPIIDT